MTKLKGKERGFSSLILRTYLSLFTSEVGGKLCITQGAQRGACDAPDGWDSRGVGGRLRGKGCMYT